MHLLALDPKKLPLECLTRRWIKEEEALARGMRGFEVSAFFSLYFLASDHRYGLASNLLVRNVSHVQSVFGLLAQCLTLAVLS